ncbi:MAG: nicotinamide riboside transporter PnuC [Gammaproteobacteria bacterium]
MSPWEGAAVLLGIAYLLLAAREHAACWACALASTVIYTVLFWNVSLLMESALNAYYVAMAAYGWWQWRHGGRDGGTLAVSTWSLRRHGATIGGVLALSALSGALLEQHTAASWPYVDSFTTWGAVVTTFMVARKVLENWLYWFVIDAVCIPLYLDRGLYLTAALFAAYLVIVVLGFVTWYRDYAAGRRELAHA